MGQVRGSGLRHAWVRAADGKWYDVDAVISLEGDLELDTTNVEGDDEILAMFSSKPTKSIKMTANSLNPELLGAITGQTPTTLSATGANGMEIGMGGLAEANPPYIELGGYTVGKLKSTDAAQTIQRIFHRVQLRLTADPQEKDSEFHCEFEGTAYQATKDITGVALTTQRIDTLRYTEQTVSTLEGLQVNP